MKWRVYTDTGEMTEWEQMITVNGVEKKASLYDLDLSTVSQLHTVDDTGLVVHTLTFSPEERLTRRPIWRRQVYKRQSLFPDGSESTTDTWGVLAGYNELMPDGSEQLYLDRIGSDGKVTSGKGLSVNLAPHEVFNEDKKRAIEEEQAARKARLDEDNELMRNTKYEPTEGVPGRIPHPGGDVDFSPALGKYVPKQKGN
jgi:hypothetical protein